MIRTMIDLIEAETKGEKSAIFSIAESPKSVHLKANVKNKF
jgi:hypothetical protein